LFYAAITKNPSGPAPQLANLASLNALSIRVPSTTLNRFPPSCGNQSFVAASNPHPIPALAKPQLNTVDPLIDPVVAYPKAIHAPNIAFGCDKTVTLALKPPASTASMPSASNAATAIISSFIWNFCMPFFSGVFKCFLRFLSYFSRFLGGGF
jgi:hypothetical protein